MAVRKLLKRFLVSRNKTRHLFIVGPHAMLVLFATATMCQFLFAWERVGTATLTIRGVFLAAAFLVYVVSRALRRQQRYDMTVLLSFSFLVCYRVFLEDFILAVPYDEKTSRPVENYWIVVLLYLCTGIPLKALLSVTLVVFIGLIVKLSLMATWQTWVVDIPVFLSYALSGLVLYYTFFCIGTEICRLRHRPLRSIKDLPAQFFRDLEERALNSLPLAVLNKDLTREEHLYILLRITQMPAFREAALQLIGEDNAFELTLPDKDKLERGFLRSALIQFHLKECPNPALKHLAGLIAITEQDQPAEELPQCEKTPLATGSSRGRRAALSFTEMSNRLSNGAKNVGFAELNLFNSVGAQSNAQDTRRPLEALASKIIAPSSKRRRKSSSQSVISNPDPFSSQALQRVSDLSDKMAIPLDQLSGNSAIATSRVARTVTVGAVTFPVLDLDRASRAPAKSTKSSDGQRRPSGNSVFTRVSARLRRRSWIVSNGKRHPRNSVNEVLELRLKHYDDILKCPKNSMWDPISVEIDHRVRFLQISWVQKYLPFLKRFATWLQGIEAVMTSAQWRRSVMLPRSGLLGNFADVKIERWFLSWVSTVHARQHILLGPLSCFVAFITNLLTWDIFVCEATQSPEPHSIRNSVIYLSIRTVCHMTCMLGLHSRQTVNDYGGPFNAQYFKRRAAAMTMIGLFLAVLDSYMHQALIPERDILLQFIILSCTTFPLFSQLTPSSHAWISTALFGLLLPILGLSIRIRSLYDSIQVIVFTCTGVSIWMLFASRCIMLNYRFLFGRYLLPYLLYLDALQEPISLYSDSSDSMCTDTDQIDSQDRDSMHNLSTP